MTNFKAKSKAARKSALEMLSKSEAAFLASEWALATSCNESYERLTADSIYFDQLAIKAL